MHIYAHRIVFVLSHRTRGPQDIRRPSSPIGAVGCTASGLSHRTGGHVDIRWPSSPIGAVACTASVLSHGTSGH